MAENKNGKISLFNTGFDPKQIGVLVLGQLPSPVTSINITSPFTVSVNLFPPIGGVSLLGVEDQLLFYKEIRDEDGNIISRDPIVTQPVSSFTGGDELVTINQLAQPLNPPIRFLTSRALPFFDPWIRELAESGFSSILNLTLSFSDPLTDGNYQGDIWVTSGTTRIGKLIINLSVIDMNKAMETDPGVAFFHTI